MCEHYSVPSTFQSLLVEAFVYPAQKLEKSTVFILKGLYSIHDSKLADSWERALIESRNNEYTFVCINTARLSVSDQTSKDAFIGKTFKQECNDVKLMFEYLCINEIISKSVPVFFIANSFGGTTLLGVPTVLEKASGIVMIASGCGKSTTTEKPILRSLYSEEILLTPLRIFNGVFIYIRGTKDTVVPKESQDKIIEAATNARVRVVCEILGAEHNLTLTDQKTFPTRLQVLASALDNIIALSIGKF